VTIEIDYRLSPPWSEGKATLDLASADEVQLRYYAFPGDQILRIDGADFSAFWGWVPLLDFAAVLVDAVAQAATGKDEEILFTENKARIVLRAEGEAVEVSCSYASGRAKIGRAELARAAKTYAARLLDELSMQFPELRSNADLKRWYPAI
jgi:hypothetical protein